MQLGTTLWWEATVSVRLENEPTDVLLTIIKEFQALPNKLTGRYSYIHQY